MRHREKVQEGARHQRVSLRGALAPRCADDGSARRRSILTLTYLGSDRVFPNYNVRRRESRPKSGAYRASIGPKGIRVNGFSGPIKTLAASGISGFQASCRPTAIGPLRRTSKPPKSRTPRFPARPGRPRRELRNVASSAALSTPWESRSSRVDSVISRLVVHQSVLSSQWRRLLVWPCASPGVSPPLDSISTLKTADESRS